MAYIQGPVNLVTHMEVIQDKSWSNWSGTVRNLAPVYYPETEEEIRMVLLEASKKGATARPVGSGHSFSPLCAVEPGGMLVSLRNYSGIEKIDPEKREVTVKAGTSLHDLNEQLFTQGLALENLGDIDVQGLAGALTTGTHGTGIDFGILATQVTALRLVTPNGEVIDCSVQKDPDVFKAALVSLGVLGIISTMTLRCVPAYSLILETGKMPLSEVLSNYQSLVENHRNFEYYWFPYTNTALTRCAQMTEDAPDRASRWKKSFDNFLENQVFGALCATARAMPGFSTAVCKISAAAAGVSTKKDHSHRIYATPRLVRFYEMEYNLPRENYPAVKRAILETFARRRFKVPFPLETRFVKEDNIWLSPANARPSAYIAVHQYQGMPYREYFDAMEEIFSAHGGRPHWGKINTRDRAFFEKNYPQWSAFCTIRAQLDPKGIMLNTYLKGLFG